MRKRMMLSIAGIGLLIASVPALAGSGDAGQEKAAIQIQAASERLMTTLSGLPEALPDGARAAIDKALANSARGFETALAALDKGRPDAASVATHSAADTSGKPDVTGLEKARASVETAFQTSADTLTEVAGKVPADVSETILAALARVEANRTVALDNLDLLIAGDRPGRASVDLPDRPARPTMPDRPERPERPDRPDVAERPDLPDRPDTPERPEVPDRPERP